MSERKAEVVELNFKKMENSDNLGVAKIWDYTYVGNLNSWKLDQPNKAVFFVPDTLVDTDRPEFTFLKDKAKYDKESNLKGSFARIKSMKLRGTFSYGLAIPAPENSNIGDNLYDFYGCGHYEPIENNSSKIPSADDCDSPNVAYPIYKYDVEGGMKYARKIFKENEPLLLTVKYHGQNWRAVYTNGQYNVSSRTNFKKEFNSPPSLPDKDNLINKLGEEKALETLNIIQKKIDNWKPNRSHWWQVLRENESVLKFLRDNPDTILYGEIIGTQGPKFRYGLKENEFSIRIFDILKNGEWLNKLESMEKYDSLPWVKIVDTKFHFNSDALIQLVESMPVFENIGSFEEGIVVSTPVERYNDYIGRSQVKFINPKYLEKS